MSDRADLLRAHIDAANDPPVIGVDDCGPWVAAWVEMVTGHKVKMPVYATRDEGYALADAAGGVVKLIEPLLAEVAILPSPAYVEPSVGDIGVIAMTDRDVPVIFTGHGHVAVRCEVRGVRFIRARAVVKMWALP